jgi:DNA-binding response OmpR family regulator
MHILIADDHAPVLDALARLLEAAGHDVVTADDGGEALDRLAAKYFPLVITDWEMPVLDGLELCRRTRARVGTPYIYIVVITGRGGEDSRLEALRAGADAFLHKPINLRDLLVHVAAARRTLASQANRPGHFAPIEQPHEVTPCDHPTRAETACPSGRGFDTAGTCV